MNGLYLHCSRFGGFGELWFLRQLFGKLVTGYIVFACFCIFVLYELFSHRYRNGALYKKLVEKHPKLLQNINLSETSEKRMKPIYEMLYILLVYLIWIPVNAFFWLY